MTIENSGIGVASRSSCTASHWDTSQEQNSFLTYTFYYWHAHTRVNTAGILGTLIDHAMYAANRQID